MEYTGWTLSDEITLVIKKDTYRDCGYPQAYLVNPKDKKQLQRAIEWGTDKKYLYDENGNSIKDDRGYSKYELIEPEIHTIKNEGFTVEFLDSAHGSYQGGKQSFWNCLVYNEDLKFVIGINSELLLYAIKQSTFTNGRSTETFKFARCSGGVGILHEDMKEYQDAIRDMESKKNVTHGKTSKWELGRNYTTLTINELYAGEIYRVLDICYDFNDKYRRLCGYNITPVIIKGYTDRKEVVTINANNFKFKSFKEYLDNAKVELDKVKLEGNNYIYNTMQILYDFCIKNNGLKKPARKPGDIKVETYEEYYKDLQNLIDNIKKKILEYIKETKQLINPCSINGLFINTYNGLSDLDIEILNYLVNHTSKGYKLIIENDDLKKYLD